jgi:hypothetical protein
MKTKKLFSTFSLSLFSASAFAQLQGAATAAENMANQVTQVAKILCIAAVTIGVITLACSFIFANDLSQVAKKRLTSLAIGLLILAAMSGIVGWVRGLTF